MCAGLREDHFSKFAHSAKTNLRGEDIDSPPCAGAAQNVVNMARLFHQIGNVMTAM